ncbi:tetratricopeptide repeat protein [Microlunatus sp. GCM10028923]|uniref:tetratricopeptide repeat protein n=1 Tax=Microlunatus sp. GCM10028923 TaxID=3273400 RepID=UPI00361414A5
MGLDSDQPPGPLDVRSYDDLATALRRLRAWSGLSIRRTHEQVDRLRRQAGRAAPGFETVRRCFEAGRTRMDTELIVDIAQILLRGDRSQALAWRRACELIESGAGSVVRIDRELPVAAADFVGRRAELRQIMAAAENPGPVVIVITGMPGTGKTALAAQTGRLLTGPESGDPSPARRMAVNLRGYDTDNPPADPAAVLDGLLREVGVKPHRFAGQAASARLTLFADAVRDRPLVLLLDNARSADQVAPLVPDLPHCVVLITSRHTLDLDATARVRLDPLTTPESLDLLRAQVGAGPVDGAPEAAAKITELAGRNPLALRLIAGRIRDHPGITLADHRDWLLDDRARGRLEDGVELALRSSYQQFPEATARLLRLLALHPGRDLDRYAAAALADQSDSAVATQLDALAAGSMLEPLPGDRFQLHDLVRAFAAEEAQRTEPPPVREAAIGRLLDYYRFAAAEAMDAYSPQNRDRRPRIAPIDRPGPAFPDRETARSWLDTEYANLVDVAVKLTGDRLPGHGVDLSTTLFAYLDDAAHHGVALRLHEHAASVADGVQRGRVLVNLGATAAELGRFQDSVGYYEQALAIHREHGDRAGEGRAYGNLGIASAQLGRHLDAIDHLERAVSIHREVGNRTNEAIASGNLCQLYQLIGRYDEARTFGQRHLKIAREIDHRLAEGVALGNLGDLDRSEGRHASALDLHEQALLIARETGTRGQEVAATNEIATDLRLLGRFDEASKAHTDALALATAQDNLIHQAKAREGLGRCLLAVDGPGSAAARSELTAALRIFTDLGVPAAADIADLLASLD